jgi:hypothetical protein
MNNVSRWCLLIDDNDDVEKYPEIKRRIESVRDFRSTSKKLATQQKSNVPHLFGEYRYKKSPSVVIPRVSSDRRNYLPTGFFDENSVVIDSAQAIYDADSIIFTILSSKMHLVWVRATAGYLKSDYRYSPLICYNNFPIPTLSSENKESLALLGFELLACREKFTGKTLSELYDPIKMPSELQSCHDKIDQLVDSLYMSDDCPTNDGRKNALFKLYIEMTGGQNA